jgi:Bifunctional DNA primase/polymerase, N-terminal/AAA domain/Primase C terminal 1 (PriCT-1)
MSAKDDAHWLAENLGWFVFPVRADKTPLPGTRWKELASDSHDAIDAMPWDGAAFAAVYCGRSGISVLDIDTKDGRIALQKMLGGLPSTMQQQTPRGGTHLIFQQPMGFEQTIGAGIPCEGVDIRSGAGYIVWYGQGDGTEWEMLPWPFTAPIGKSKPAPAKPSVSALSNVEGGRNDATAREAGSILSDFPQTTLNSLIDQLLRFNADRNNPPLETWEIEKTARSIFLKAASAVHEPPQIEVRYEDLGELVSENMAPTRYVCAPFVAEGYTLYVGPPKVGKTTLMRQLAIAAHTGADFMGFPCQKTEVLFLSLEEGRRMFRGKTIRMGYQSADLSGLRIAFEWPSGEAGLVKLHEHMAAHPDTKLIIVDGMARIKGHQHTKTASVFDVDYLEGRMLQEFAKQYPGLALIVLHHTRKMESLDPMDMVSGSRGVVAAPDMICVLFKGAGGQYIMHWEGREWMEEENSYEISREHQRWTYVGTMSDAEAGLRPNAVRQASILAMLRDKGEMTGLSLSNHLGVSAPTISEACKALAKHGAVKRGEIGWISVV